MKHWWWKILAVVLLLIVAFISLRTPLSTAIVHVDPYRLETGDFTTHITGYNSSFDKANDLKVWLWNDGQPVCANDIQVIDANELKATFDVPTGMRSEMTDVFLQSKIDGRILLRDAYWTSDTGQGFSESPCDGINAKGPLKLGFTFPMRSLLYESIRNLNFHVPMWFAMMLLMSISVFFSIRYLMNSKITNDEAAASAVKVSLIFAVLGILTGATWARATWGAWWTDDTKLNGAAVVTLIYLAYLILRSSIPDQEKRARLSSVYNIFAYVLMIVLLMVLPRLTDSLHPGNGGNPAFSQYDLDSSLRMVFYPAVIGWFLLGLWMYNLHRRWTRVNNLIHHDEDL